ncbi:hypothetical protein ACWGCK_17065 [Streptomyces virginiae]
MAAVVAMCVALAGAGMAFLWFYVAWWIPVVVVVVVAAAGLILRRSGPGRVATAPRTAMRLMEWQILLPGSLAAAGAAAIVVVEIYLQTEEGWSDEAKGIVTALSAAITAAIGALLVKGAETYDESWLAPPIKRAFEEGLNDTFARGTPGDQALYSLQGNWDRADRRARLEAIEKALKAAGQSA